MEQKLSGPLERGGEKLATTASNTAAGTAPHSTAVVGIELHCYTSNLQNVKG